MRVCGRGRAGRAGRSPAPAWRTQQQCRVRRSLGGGDRTSVIVLLHGGRELPPASVLEATGTPAAAMMSCVQLLLSIFTTASMTSAITVSNQSMARIVPLWAAVLAAGTRLAANGLTAPGLGPAIVRGAGGLRAGGRDAAGVLLMAVFWNGLTAPLSLLLPLGGTGLEAWAALACPADLQPLRGGAGGAGGGGAGGAGGKASRRVMEMSDAWSSTPSASAGLTRRNGLAVAAAALGLGTWPPRAARPSSGRYVGSPSSLRELSAPPALAVWSQPALAVAFAAGGSWGAKATENIAARRLVSMAVHAPS
jgi:hypothetical protein